jgi:hypothetical protein
VIDPFDEHSDERHAAAARFNSALTTICGVALDYMHRVKMCVADDVDNAVLFDAIDAARKLL